MADRFTSITPALILALAYMAWALPCAASFPVPYAMVGCMEGNKFVTQSELRSRPFKSTWFTSLEGKTIRIEGLLYPVDFEAMAIHLVADTCKKELLTGYFLCDPCQTNLSQSPSKPAPARERGVRLQVASEALEELRGLNARLSGIR